MDLDLFPDFARSIRYALTPRPAQDGTVEIVLDLFRGATPALTRTVAAVRAGDAAPLLQRCRRHLERLGAHAVTQSPPEPDPDWAAPASACSWFFAG